MSFFDELKRRNVFRVGIAYLVVAWLVLQVADVVINNVGAPGWVFQIIMLVLGIGFPIVLIFAWAFEMTPEGIKKEKDVDRSQSITNKTGRKLDFTIIGIMALALVYFVWESRFSEMGSEPFSQETSVQKTEASNEKRALTPFKTDNSIAVLPFANRSRDEDDAFFSDGIHDDLLTQLAKIGDLKVISRTSVMKYKDTQKTIPEIAEELGVSTILEGGIQRAGKRIRINAQLIDVTTDEHLWAETFDREMTMENIFDIQTEITRQIVTAVKGELSEAEQQALGARLTDNIEAYEAHLHARAATNRAGYSQEKYIEAQPWAEKAVKLDPEFAEAWALLTEIHAQAVWIGYDRSPKRYALASEALEKALQLKPDSATIKAAQADHYYRFDNDYSAALNAYEQAHELAPGDARILLYTAITLRRLGKWDDSISALEESMALDPANVFTATQMAGTLGLMNEWDRLEGLVSEWINKYPDSRDLKGSQVRAKIIHHGDLKSARELFDLLQPWPGIVYSGTANKLAAYERDFDTWLAIQDSPAVQQYNQLGDDIGLTKGIIYHLMGNTEQSKHFLNKQLEYAMARQPTNNYTDGFVLSGQASAPEGKRPYLRHHDCQQPHPPACQGRKTG